ASRKECVGCRTMVRRRFPDAPVRGLLRSRLRPARPLVPRPRAPDSIGTCLSSFLRQVRAMSPNKQTVHAYMEAFGRTDHAAILACLTDDVEWVIPGAVHLRGKEAFDGEIENEAFVGSPTIAVTRMVE